MTLWDFLNSDFGLLVVGFALTGLIGALLSASFQKAAWRRETRLELFRKRYDEGVAFLDTLGELIGRRFFATQQMLWSIQRGLNEAALQGVAKSLNDATEEWNNRLRMNRAKIRLLVNDAYANRFMNLHKAFVEAHQAVVELSEGKGEVKATDSRVEDLNRASSEFLETLTNEFLRRASSLEILDVAERHVSDLS